MWQLGDKVLTAGGDKFMLFDPLRSCGPMLECLRIGSPPPGVPPNTTQNDTKLDEII